MKKLDWDRLVPLGMDGKAVRNRLLLAWGVGVGWSLRFLVRYAAAFSDLFLWQDGKRYLLAGARIVPFAEIVDNSFLLLGVAALCMLPVAAVFYGYHYLAGRSI